MALCTLGGVAVEPTSATAQEVDREVAKKVVELIREAKELEQQDKWDEALANYEKAYEMLPKPQLLFAMGRAAEEAGETRKAIDYYERFVEADPSSSAARKVAAEGIPRLKATIPPTLKIVSKPAGANVYFDDLTTSPVGSTPLEREMEPGIITVFIKLDGYETARQEVELEGADEEEISVTLAKAESVEDVAVTDADESGTSAGQFTTWGIVTTSVGVALLGTGGVFSALQAGTVNDVNTYDKSGASSPDTGRAEIEDLKDQANSQYRAALVSYISGGVITAAGVALLSYGLLSEPDVQSADGASDKKRMNWRFGASADSVFMGIHGTF